MSNYRFNDFTRNFFSLSANETLFVKEKTGTFAPSSNELYESWIFAKRKPERKPVDRLPNLRLNLDTYWIKHRNVYNDNFVNASKVEQCIAQGCFWV